MSNEGQEWVASGYLPMECPVCGRVRLEYFIDSRRNLDIRCEKCYSDKESLIEAFETDHRDAQHLRGRVRVLEKWVVDHEMHEEGCPQADNYNGEWDTGHDGALRKWLDEHQTCTCGMWELLGRVSLDDDENRALLSPVATEGEGA